MTWQPIATVPKDTTVFVYWPGHPQGKDHEIRTAMFPQNYPMGSVPCTLWTSLPELPNGYEIIGVVVRKTNT